MVKKKRKMTLSKENTQSDLVRMQWTLHLSIFVVWVTFTEGYVGHFKLKFWFLGLYIPFLALSKCTNKSQIP